MADSVDVDAGGTQTSVLIADDQPVMRAGLRAMLDHPDIEVVGEVVSGAEAAARVRARAPDLVLMDVEMPDMDGLTATRVIKEASPEVAVIILTAIESEEYLRQAIEAGAAGYVLKGATRELLLHSIQVVRDGGSMFDASLLAALLRDLPRSGEPVRDDASLRLLTEREHDVLRRIVEGQTNRQIAEGLSYSIGTVKNDVQSIIKKLAVSDRTQAAAYAVRHGIDAG